MSNYAFTFYIPVAILLYIVLRKFNVVSCQYTSEEQNNLLLAVALGCLLYHHFKYNKYNLKGNILVANSDK